MVVRTIFPGVREWSFHSPEHKVELTAHAVEAGDGSIVVDPIGDPAAWTGGSPVSIVLTNGNHERAAAGWGRRFKCPVWIPGGFESPLDGARRFGPGESPVGGWETVALDGGGPGETAFRIPALDLVVFGDALVNLPGHGLGILPDKYCGDPARLRDALRRLVARPFSRAVFAHGAPLPADASVRIAALL